jgi:hypothetical protein
VGGSGERKVCVGKILYNISDGAKNDRIDGGFRTGLEECENVREEDESIRSGVDLPQYESGDAHGFQWRRKSDLERDSQAGVRGAPGGARQFGDYCRPLQSRIAI